MWSWYISSLALHQFFGSSVQFENLIYDTFLDSLHLIISVLSFEEFYLVFLLYDDEFNCPVQHLSDLLLPLSSLARL